MIVTNDYLYTAQYCPAMEDLAGSSIFNNLSLNQFTFSKNRPRPQEFSQYLGRIYRGGDTSPFTPEEDHWLLFSRHCAGCSGGAVSGKRGWSGGAGSL